MAVKMGGGTPGIPAVPGHLVIYVEWFLDRYLFALQVDANMRSAMKRDAVLSEKFFFRKDLMTGTMMTYVLLSSPHDWGSHCKWFLQLIKFILYRIVEIYTI